MRAYRFQLAMWEYVRSLSKELPIELSNLISSYSPQSSVPVDLIKSLIAASKSNPVGIQEQILYLAEKLDQPHRSLKLKAEIIHQKSVAMRLKGNISSSEHAIQAFLSSLTAGTHDLTNEDLAALYLSQATNYACHFNFAKAHGEVMRWTPSMDLSGRQEQLLWDQVLCVGRVMRGEGHFQQTKACFDACLATPGLNEPKRFLVKSALADLCCELDYLSTGQQTCYLSQAEAIVGPEVQRLRLHSCQSRRGYRRLLLWLLEVKIKQGQHHDADSLARELLVIYSNVQALDIIDRLGHVRSLIGFARVSPTLEVALQRWKDVLAWNSFYNLLEEEVFTCGVVHLFVCVTWYTLGDTNRSMESFRDAMRVISRRRPQFLIPGMGTYLFHSVTYLPSAVYK